MISRVVFLLIGSFMGLASCKQDDPAPLPYEVSSKLLAGDKGDSKSWRLIAMSEQVGTGTIDPVAISGCIADNLYTFSNNPLQTYQSTEGPDKCYVSHPDLIEEGSWTFSSDGKTVMILSNHVFPSNPGSLFSFFGFAFPAEVIELKEDSFQIEMTYIKELSITSVTKYYRLSFAKAE